MNESVPEVITPEMIVSIIKEGDVDGLSLVLPYTSRDKLNDEYEYIDSIYLAEAYNTKKINCLEALTKAGVHIEQPLLDNKRLLVIAIEEVNIELFNLLVK